MDCRLSLLVRPHPHDHALAFSGAAYGFGSTSSCAMYPTKHAAARKTRSTIHGVLCRLGESLNLKRLPCAGLSSLAVYLCLHCMTQNSFGQPSASPLSPSRTTNSAEQATSLEKLSVPPEDTYLLKSVLRQSLVRHVVTMCIKAAELRCFLAWQALTDRHFVGVMDFVSVTSVIISGILIFTAIQAQDFPDVEGDKAVGRMTFPIYAPELSRILTLFATIAWSVFLSWFWQVGPISTALFTSFGIHVGLRYYCWRTLEADRKSYLIFNVRISFSHSPRWGHPETSFLTYGRPRFGSWPPMYFLCMPGRPFWRSDDDSSPIDSSFTPHMFPHILCYFPARLALDRIFIMDGSSLPYMYTFV